MADLVIREEDGWIEISDLVEEMLSSQVVDDLWDFLAEEHIVEAVELLDMELGGELEARIGHTCVQNIRMVEMAGERVRVWVKR